ncbi:MAG: hypothetical protein ACRC6O_13350 [Flavobacterium sp.]
MKTTNFEISKKLAEIGFKETSLIGHFLDNEGNSAGTWIIADGIREGYEFDCYAYDLETILEALPEFFKDYQDDECNLKLSKNSIWYENEFGSLAWLCSYEVVKIDKEEKESLADCAARLLIKLFEAGIINFNN